MGTSHTTLYFVTAIRPDGTLVSRSSPTREDCDDYAPTGTNKDHPLCVSVIPPIKWCGLKDAEVGDMLGIETLSDGSMQAVFLVDFKTYPVIPLLPTLTSTQVDAPVDSTDWDASASHWRCTLTYEGRRMSVQYHMGSAHKSSPELLGVLGCLFSDASSGDTDFSDFCSEFGYEEDSRKAEKTWKACASMNVRLHKLLGSDYSNIETYVQGEGY